MPKIIKIRCNGTGKHINEVDLEKYTKPTIVVRGGSKAKLPERLVIPCQECVEGKIIITREMIEKLEDESE